MSDNIKSMNFAITVDDGSRRVPIQNMQGEEIGAFTFRPTDIGIVERFNAMVGEFDAITEPLGRLSMSSGNGQAIFAKGENDLPGIEDSQAGRPEGLGDDLENEQAATALAEAKDRLYRAVDKLFGGEGVAEAFFGKMHPFSPVNGAFYCETVLQAVGQYIGAQFETETAKFSDRAKKYAKKARK